MEDYTNLGINTYKYGKNFNPIQKYRYSYDLTNMKLMAKPTIHWRQNNNTKNTRNSQQSSKSKKSIQDEMLKLNSKHTSVVGKNQNKSRTLSDYILNQCKIDHDKINKMIEDHQKSIVNDQVDEQISKMIDKIIKENSKEQDNSKNRNNYEFLLRDDRQQKILINKKKSNIKILMNQTKQMITLTEAHILEQQRKFIKSKVMELEIQVRRLKISMRTKQNKKNHVIQEYYVKQTQSKYKARQKYSMKKPLSRSGSGRKTQCSEYFNQQIKSEFYQERSILLQARLKNIKEQIRVQKRDYEQRQKLIKEQIQLLRKEKSKFIEATDRASVCVSQLNSRLSTLAINSKINKVDFNSPRQRNKKSYSESQYKTSLIRPIRFKNYLIKN